MSKKKITTPPYDFYAIQRWTDGFGNDTYTIACCPTEEEAIAYRRKRCSGSCKIVGQYWNKDYRNTHEI